MSGYGGFGYTALLKDQTVDETTSKWVDVRGRQLITFYVSGTGTTSSGVITLEECLAVGDPANANQEPLQYYPGTASPIYDVNASDVTGDKQKAIHVSPASYGFVRARISTVIGGGGSISVGLVAV